MKQVTWTITENTPLTPDTYRLRLAGDTEAITAPGQFVNLKLSGFYLRRPISVCDWEPGAATLIYKVLGHGIGGHDPSPRRNGAGCADRAGQRLRHVSRRGAPPAGGRRRRHPAPVRTGPAA
ncbi:MAG: hypothetical protein ACLR01_08415 [Vescimonas sp.]